MLIVNIRLNNAYCRVLETLVRQTTLHASGTPAKTLHNSVNACDPTQKERMGLLSYAMTICAIGVGLFALVRVSVGATSDEFALNQGSPFVFDLTEHQA